MKLFEVHFGHIFSIVYCEYCINKYNPLSLLKHGPSPFLTPDRDHHFHLVNNWAGVRTNKVHYIYKYNTFIGKENENGPYGHGHWGYYELFSSTLLHYRCAGCLGFIRFVFVELRCGAELARIVHNWRIKRKVFRFLFSLSLSLNVGGFQFFRWLSYYTHTISCFNLSVEKYQIPCAFYASKWKK